MMDNDSREEQPQINSVQDYFEREVGDFTETVTPAIRMVRRADGKLIIEQLWFRHPKPGKVIEPDAYWKPIPMFLEGVPDGN
jgi:hypothetical protein